MATGALTPRETVLAALRHEETDITPYQIGFLEEPMARMGRLAGEHWESEIVRYLAGWQVSVAREPLAADGDLYRDEFGAVWQKGSIWHITEPPLKEASLAGYRWPDLTNADRYAGLARFGERHPDQYRVAYIGTSFFEQYWKLRGWEALGDFAHDPTFAETLLDKFLETALAQVERLAREDVDCIGVCDDQSDQRGVTIGPARWRRMLKPRFKCLFERVHGLGKLTFLHCCGNCFEIVPDLIEVGLDFLNPLQPECMDIFALKREYGRDLLLEGGIGTQQLLPFATAAEVRAAVDDCRLKLGRDGGYILAPTKAVRPETPDANMLALFDALVHQQPRSALVKNEATH